MVYSGFLTRPRPLHLDQIIVKMKRTCQKARPKSIFALMAILTLVLYSCNKGDYNSSDFVAGDLFTDSHIRVVHIDTCTVAISTMKFDSIITSQATRMLIGKYTDPVFGTVRSSGYMEFLPSTYTIDSEAEYDSIVFYLGMDKYYYNDTLKTNTIEVRQLSESLTPEDGTNFYNTSNAVYEEGILGSLSYMPRPMTADSLAIRLSDSLGLRFFKKLQTKEITNADEFKDDIKGLTLQSGEADNGSIIGFSLESEKSYLRLYFSTSEINERSQNYIDFTVPTGNIPIPFFNRITVEEPNGYLKTIENGKTNLRSEDSDHHSFIQSGIGIATRIQFPFIKNIYDIPGNGTLLDAVLKIRPAQQSYDQNLILRDSLSVYLVDGNNALTQQLTVTAILNRENQEFNDIYYKLPLSDYLEKLLTTEKETGEALILLPDNYNNTVDRFVLNGGNNGAYSTSLELTYSIYSDEE